MKNPKIPTRIFPEAREDAHFATLDNSTIQTRSPSYRLAFQDTEFLLREDLRPVRFQLELLKPELLMNEAGIGSTFVMYGSARIPEPGASGRNDDPKVNEKLAVLSRYYDEARKLAQMVSQVEPAEDGTRHFVVCSGGGPSIMAAANRGAADVGQTSIGLNIVLPHEQAPNEYVTPELSFQFHYFALRKMHFLLRARAVAVFPGGFGTFDEMFELLTLIQTGKIPAIPVILFGREFWETAVGWNALADSGVISRKDLDLFKFVETADEAWAIVKNWYAANGD